VAAASRSRGSGLWTWRARKRRAATLWGHGGGCLAVYWRILTSEAAGQRGEAMVGGGKVQAATCSPVSCLPQLWRSSVVYAHGPGRNPCAAMAGAKNGDTRGCCDLHGGDVMALTGSSPRLEHQGSPWSSSLDKAAAASQRRSLLGGAAWVSRGVPMQKLKMVASLVFRARLAGDAVL
jgi:hypothetical protein